MKFELVLGIIYILLAISGVIGVAIFWNTPDAGFVRYGVILPLLFLYKGIQSLNSYNDMKKEAQNGNTKYT